jgi:Berberine and berberine like
LRSPLKPEHDEVKVMSYFDAQAAGFRPAPFAHFQSNVFLPKMSEAAVQVITTAVNNGPRQFRVLMVGFIGAITRVRANETAFALRQPGVEIDILGSWSAPAEKADAVQWVKALRDSLRPFARGVYVNQLGETSDELVREAYTSNYERLAEIKRKYDPNNVLRRNQNIKPA